MREYPLRIKLSKNILKYRWLLVLLMSILFNGFEIVEHVIEGQFILDDPNFLREAFMFGIFAPFLTGSILTLLAKTESERVRVIRQLNLEQELAMELSDAVTWDDLSSSLLAFPRKIAPFSAITLLVGNSQNTLFTVEAHWSVPGLEAALNKPVWANQCECFVTRRWHLLSIKFFPEKILPHKYSGFCLPLILGRKPIGMLHLFLPTTEILSEDQIKVLNNVAPSMALAIDRLHPQASSIIWAAASATERQRLARHLHDTLGQNLGYLSLKLDQLKGDDVLKEVAAVREELAQMHSIANQAYEQVRTTLTTLNRSQAIDLEAAIGDLTQKMSPRTGSVVRITRQGEKRPLPPLVQQKILGIVGEALANIAKHAQASSASINLNWTEEMVTISIEDNGCGFSYDKEAPGGHFGLAIMHSRAQEINSRLTIHSEPQKGTTINLEVPYPPVSQ